MSKVKLIPIRQKSTRKAKEKASIEIMRYFKPKTTLQVVPENSDLMLSKDRTTNDKNNNSKRNFKHLSKEMAKSDEKGSFSDAKRMKTKGPASQSKPKSKKTEPKTHSKDVAKSKIKSASKKMAKPVKSTKETESNGSSTSSLSEVVLRENRESSNSVIVINDSVISTQEKFDFDTLQTDDSSSEEEEGERHPYWSLYKNRIAIVNDQSDIESRIIDNLFGSKAENVIFEIMFPTSKPIHRRRSTAVWNTPPRYSMLPKY